MERRKFLGLFGAAAISGPSIAQAAAMDSLQLSTLGAVPKGLGWFDSDPAQDIPPMPGLPQVGGNNHWAWLRLKALKRMNPWTRTYREKTFRMEALDPNTASLRSVALGQKIRISRRVQLHDAIELERQRYHGIVRGWLEN